ncbi:MAG: permease prefix domain 1-containing protein [Lachnospiraceae bacterium]|nr:permease prefix domain 1-containing protein [Lachnospiraceae bacterium]
METLKNYLENMFLNLPDTPEVRKARKELLQMMEDKYTELINEGKAQNEAIGVVISEFGNLEELAADLGIKTYVEEEVTPPHMLSLEEAKEFLKDTANKSQLIALGVMFCILSPVPTIIIDGLAATNSQSSTFNRLETLDALFLFLFVAIGVAFFIFASATKRKWQQIEEHTVGINFQTIDYVRKQFKASITSHTLLLCIGCVLCILSIIPEIFIDAFVPMNLAYSGAFFLTMIAIGVYLIVFTCNRNKGYQSLLALNAKGTMGNTHVPQNAKKAEYTSPTVAFIMEVYWQTITCFYLCISFLTYDWDITWIIWPVAALIHNVVKINFQKS